MTRLLLVGLIIFCYAVKTHYALFADGRSIQEIVDSMINKTISKLSKKIQDKLEVFKDSKLTFELWKIYKSFYQKVYATDDEEKQRCRKFIDNLKMIVRENLRFDKGVKSFKLHMNQFGDMDLEEFQKKWGGLKMDDKEENITSEPMEIKNINKTRRCKRLLTDSIKKKIKKIKDYFGNETNQTCASTFGNIFKLKSNSLNETIDYRPYMNPVENQGNCSACYAFAATATIEGAYAIKHGKRFKMSNQQIIDCSSNYGCSYGYLTVTYKYIKQNGGLQPDESYPYTGTKQACHTNATNVGSIRDYGKMIFPSENKMKQLLNEYGPVASAIHITSDLQFYGRSLKSGESDILDLPKCSQSVNHGVVIVGYGTDNGTDYWLVRNSWGDKWGLDGYFKIARNKNFMCGIAISGFYAKL